MLTEWVLTNRGQWQEGSGQPRVTTAPENRSIIQAAVTVPDSSLATIQHVTNNAATTRTVSQWPQKQNLWSQCPLHRLPLGTMHRWQKLQLCWHQSVWHVWDWRWTVFCDPVFTEPWERQDPAFTVACHMACQWGLWCGVPFPMIARPPWWSFGTPSPHSDTLIWSYDLFCYHSYGSTPGLFFSNNAHPN